MLVRLWIMLAPLFWGCVMIDVELLNESWAGFSLSVLHVQGRYMYVFGASNIFETIPFCWVLWVCEGRGRDARIGVPASKEARQGEPSD